MLLQQARPSVWKSIDVQAWAEVKEINVLVRLFWLFFSPAFTVVAFPGQLHV